MRFSCDEVQPRKWLRHPVHGYYCSAEACQFGYSGPDGVFLGLACRLHTCGWSGLTLLEDMLVRVMVAIHISTYSVYLVKRAVSYVGALKAVATL
jgi:hypothetical protein